MFEGLIVAAGGLLILVVACLFILTGMLLLELVAGRSAAPQLASRPSGEVVGTGATFVVVMPAHNEVGTIEDTLTSLDRRELGSHGRVLVVADNCSDATGDVARKLGAEVIERFDAERRGKGYALDFAVRHLSAAPPDVVVVLDADCQFDAGSLGELVDAVAREGRPVQARYELLPPGADAGLAARLGAFAWYVKNVLRPLGLLKLGIGCPLMGTGMAFPWRVISTYDLATGHLVEDMVMGLELAARGEAPKFLPGACIRSALPQSREGQTSQRTRWETGHLQVIRKILPKVALRAIGAGDARLFGMVLHTAVPPLALLALLLVVATLASALVYLAGGSALAFGAALCTDLMAALILSVYVLRTPAEIITAKEIRQVPLYVFSKLALYGRALTGYQPQWTRTKRD